MGTLTRDEQAAIEAAVAAGRVQRVAPPVAKSPPPLRRPADEAPPPSKAPEPRAVRRMGVRQALEWAFGVERAQLAFGAEALGGVGLPRFGMEFLLMERAMLGQEIDVSRGRSLPADDAELIAACVQSALAPADAIWIAELARGGLTPDPMAGVVPRLQPAEWHGNRHGWHGKRADAAQLRAEGWAPERRRNRKGVIVEDPVWYTPTIWSPGAEKVAAARRAYQNWRGYLLTLRPALQAVGLRWVEVTDAMPPLAPWRTVGADG
jgi:hypothetical protein